VLGRLPLDQVGSALGIDARAEVLRQVSDRLRAAVQVGELPARIGEAEFALLVPMVDGPRSFLERAERVLESVSAPARVGSVEVALDAAAGVALSTGRSVQARELVRQATVALTLTERTGVRVEPYRMEDDPAGGLDGGLLASELVEALGSGELVLRYEPVVDLHTGAPLAVEATPRWLHLTRGLVMPERFMPTLQQPELVGRYAEWLLREAVVQRSVWVDLDPALAVSVKLPAGALLGRGLRGQVSEALMRVGLPPNQLMVEVAESLALGPVSTVDAVLESLREVGTRVAVGGFGRGTSSLTRLIRVPASDVKLAAEVVESIRVAPESEAIARAAVEIARGTGMRVTAVGALTVEDLLAARDAGVQAAQGPALYRPMVASRAHAALVARAREAAQQLVVDAVDRRRSSAQGEPD
jgi:EAL domain-containing protein (putative c-di-GMP-specific phosphodiesterase class I)